MKTHAHATHLHQPRRRLRPFQPRAVRRPAPACLITMQRHKGAYGYFSGEPLRQHRRTRRK